MRHYTRREMMMMAEEVVYDGFTRWKYDTHQQSYGKNKYWCEYAWCRLNTPQTGKIQWYATSYTGRHKTLDVKEGQKYKVKTGALPTQIVFCNDHVWSARTTIDAYCISIAAGTEMIITVPAGWKYMMIWFYRSTNNEIIFPARIARLKGYG